MHHISSFLTHRNTKLPCGQTDETDTNSPTGEHQITEPRGATRSTVARTGWALQTPDCPDGRKSCSVISPLLARDFKGRGVKGLVCVHSFLVIAVSYILRDKLHKQTQLTASNRSTCTHKILPEHRNLLMLTQNPFALDIEATPTIWSSKLQQGPDMVSQGVHKIRFHNINLNLKRLVGYSVFTMLYRPLRLSAVKCDGKVIMISEWERI
jgi:hypothetical protein